jgi:SAM-dependent methyltransferase
MTSKLSYALTIFLGAFLLFEVQPLIAKIILPWFGGAAAVWIFCLLFFQFVLLFGYAYAHWLGRIESAAVQGRVHAVLLALSLLTLPIYPRAMFKPTGPESPAPHILLLLAATVGLCYFLLSTTSPLLQRWYAREHSGAPYGLYALSNVGSMLALLSYPVVIEPRVTTHHQAAWWSVAYAIFALLCGAIALKSKGDIKEDDRVEEVEERLGPSAAATPSASLQILWVALAACGSALLLSVTNHVSQNVAAVPFLWIVPLSLYLFSFILCFAPYPLYSRGLFMRLLGIALGAMVYALSPSFVIPEKLSLGLFCAGLFLCCMFCHGELARLRPPARHLTSFYLMISLGGAIGALLVALVAPHVFTGFYELHVALASCAILVVIVNARDHEGSLSLIRLQPGGLVLAGLAIAVIAGLVSDWHEDSENVHFGARNFYGEVRVVEAPISQIAPGLEVPPGGGADPRARMLLNGTINHGMQYLVPALRRVSTTYYTPHSGIVEAIRAAGKSGPVKVGIVGLGAGTTAVFGRAGDRFTYYEINPLVIRVAREQFTFLSDSPATVRVVEGDARLSLENEEPQAFDILGVDAFSGDSIPVHLLTLEAFQLYFRQLKPRGVLAVHVSNRFLDLRPIVSAAAARLGKEAVLIQDSDRNLYASNWILVGDPRGFEGQADLEDAGAILLPGTRSHLWTDDFSNLFEALR